MLEYRVLGALRVFRDGEELHVGGPRQRCLLAALLLHSNEVVSTDRLVEAVFAGSATAKAATTLRTYVMRLRRVLEDGDADPVLATEPPGYRLSVAVDAVDARRLETLAAEGRDQLARGEPAVAAARFEQALDLWGGEPYAEFAGELWVLAEAQRLKELRSLTEEQLVAALLETGRAAELVGRLEAMVERRPLREAPRAQLMLALYRSGRQADALGVMRDYRELLASETGLDPSPELQQLEQRILVHDEALQRPGSSERAVRGYRLGERLGSGRDGTVHVAQLPGVERDLVIRVVPPELADRPDVVRSFDTRMRRVAALHHRAIVPIDDHWREPGGAYVVLRRMWGGTLRDRLDHGGLPPPEVVELARRIGSALEAAHDAGVVHGRVIPESVLFDDSGAPHLSDIPLGDVAAGPADDAVALATLLHGAMPADEHAATTDRSQHAPWVRVLEQAASTEKPTNVSGLLADFERALGAADLGGPPPNPYKGLRAFDEADVADFFGRERLVAELVDRLGGQGLVGRLVLVVGASGSGKSSVVRAGLLPSVRAGAFPGSDRWLVTTMVPGTGPFEELAESLSSVAIASGSAKASGQGPAEARALREYGIDWALRQIVPEGSELLLVVDQLEELFTLADEADQRAFLEALVRAVSAADSRLRVVATLRADFYDQPLRFRGFGELVRDATVAVPAMSAAQLERTIRGPADRVGLDVEPTLVAELVAAVVDQPAAMPSLQLTLYELAEQGERGLHLASYERLGGVGGAIAARAEDLYESLEDGDDVLRRIFEQLVVIGLEGEPTRRSVLVRDLAGLVGSRDIDEVLDPWVSARLLQRDRHPETREPTVEVAHEALLRGWPRLRGWIEADRAAIVVATDLRHAAQSWETHDRDPGALHRGVKLEAALQQLGDRIETLPETTRAFVDASLEARDQRRALEAERAAHQQRTNRRLRRQLAALAVATVVALVGGVVAVDQRQQALDDRRLAETRELAAASTAVVEEDAELAVLLALEAVDQSRAGGGRVLPEVQRALHRAVTSSRAVLHVRGIGGSVSWHPDGSTFVTEGPEESGLVDIRDAATGDSVRTWTGHDADINDVAFNADGSLLATAGDNGLLRVWDAATGDLVAELEGLGQVWGVTFSPDGSRVAAGWFSEGIVRVLRLDAEEPVLRMGLSTPPWTDSMSFSPDSRRLAIANPEGVTVVDVEDDERLFELGTPWAEAVAWSPDGRWIASASDGTTPRITRAEPGGTHIDLAGHTAKVFALSWSADGARLATGADDGTSRVFSVNDDRAREDVVVATREGAVWGVALSANGDLLLTGDMVASSTRIWAVGRGGGAEWANLPTGSPAASFTPDGESLLLGGLDAAAVLWDPVTGETELRFGDGLPAAESIETSPDGELVATTGDGSNSVRVWDRRSGREVFTTTVPGLIPFRVAWSPDGQVLAVGGGDQHAAGRIGIVDRTGDVIAVLEDDELDRKAFEVAFSADGELLIATRNASSRADPTLDVRVWDWARGEPLLDLPVFSETVAADPTASRVAVPVLGGDVELWDPRTGEHLVTLVGHTGRVTDVAFSADGARLATSGADGTVRLWATDTGNQQLVLEGHDSEVDSVAFAPDGDRLVSTGAGLARVWAIDIDDLVTIAASRVTRSLTDPECRQYLRTETCPD